MKKLIASALFLVFMAVLPIAAQTAKTNGSTTNLGTQDSSGAAHTSPATVGASDPAACVVGAIHVNTASTPIVKLCTATNTWTAVGGSSPTAISTWLSPYGFVANNFGAVSPASGSAHVTQYFEVLVPYPGMLINFVTATPTSATQGHVAWTLWDTTCTTAISTTNTITPSASVANNWTFAGNPLTVAPGKYFVMLTSDAATTSFSGAFVANIGDALNTGESAGNLHVFTGSNPSTGTTTLAPPATCGTRSGTLFASGSGIIPSFQIH